MPHYGLELISKPRHKDKAAILRFGVLARLLLADQRILVFRLGFKNDQRKAGFIHQKKIDEAVAGVFKILAQGVDGGLGQFDLGLESNICFAFGVVEKSPA